MGNTILRNASDSWTTSSRPTLNRSTTARLGLDSAGDIRRAFILFSRPFPLGCTILEATLRIRNSGTWTASTTLTVQRIAAKYSMSRIHSNNQPGVVAGTATSGPKSNSVDGTIWEFDVTALLQTVANGGVWYGFRIVTNVDALRWIYGANGPADMRPELEITWADEPDAPETLYPGGGRSVGTPKPIFSFDFTDVSGDTSLQAFQFQIDSASDFATPTWDSGTIFATVPEFVSALYWLNNSTNSGFETNTVDWAFGAAAGSGTLTRTTAQFSAGVASGQLTKDGTAGTMWAQHGGIGLAGRPIVGGQSYFVRLKMKAATVARTCQAALDWYDAAGLLISTTLGTGVVDSTSAWSGYVSATGPAPLNAAFMGMRAVVNSAAAAETHYVDEIWWQAGGTAISSLTSSTLYYWRVKVQDAAGLWSEWSLPESTKYTVYPVILVTNPSAGTPTVGDVTPPITWTVTGGTQVTFQVLLYDVADLSTALYTSSKYTSTDLDFTIPEGYITDLTATYRVFIRVWDTVDRETNGVNKTYVENFRTFTYSPAAGTTVVTSLVATQQTPYPWVDVTWNRTTLPDRYNIERDGEIIDTVEGSDVFVSGTAYKYTDKLAAPRIFHTYRVIPVVSGVSALTANPSATVTTRLTCPVLMMEDGSNPVYFMSPSLQPQSMTMQERLDPVGSAPVLITQYLGGNEGSLEGLITDDVPSTLNARTMRDYFKLYRKNVGQTLLLYNIDEVMRVIPYNMTYRPEAYSGNKVRYRAKFDFFEVD